MVVGIIDADMVSSRCGNKPTLLQNLETKLEWQAQAPDVIGQNRIGGRRHTSRLHQPLMYPALPAGFGFGESTPSMRPHIMPAMRRPPPP